MFCTTRSISRLHKWLGESYHFIFKRSEQIPDPVTGSLWNLSLSLPLQHYYRTFETNFLVQVCFLGPLELFRDLGNFRWIPATFPKFQNSDFHPRFMGYNNNNSVRCSNDCLPALTWNIWVMTWNTGVLIQQLIWALVMWLQSVLPCVSCNVPLMCLRPAVVWWQFSE